MVLQPGEIDKSVLTLIYLVALPMTRGNEIVLPLNMGENIASTDSRGKKVPSKVPRRRYLLGPWSYYSIMFFNIILPLVFENLFRFPCL